VDPGSVAALDLTDEIGAGPAAVRLRSDADLVATLRTTTGTDHSYAAQVAPLGGPAVVVATGSRTLVQLSSGGSPATARLTAYDGVGKPVGERAVTLPPSGLMAWPVPRGTAYAVVTPRTGELHLGSVHQGPGTASRPGWELPVTLSRPVVRPLGHPGSHYSAS
jgi:hypothetical protein